jgi:hypothetical protein
MTTSSSVAAAAEELARERDRVTRRLRSMPLEAIPVARVLAVGQALADLAATASGGQVRVVPLLQPYAAGDQVAVLTGEVLSLLQKPQQSRTAELAGATELAELAEQARFLLADLRGSL